MSNSGGKDAQALQLLRLAHHIGLPLLLCGFTRHMRGAETSTGLPPFTQSDGVEGFHAAMFPHQRRVLKCCIHLEGIKRITFEQHPRLAATAAATSIVGRRPIDLIDHEHIERALLRLQSQTELLLKGLRERRIQSAVRRHFAVGSPDERDLVFAL